VKTAHQLLAHGRWFTPGIPASFTTKTGRHDIAEILLKVAFNTKHQIKSNVLINRSQVVVAVDFEQTRINYGKKGIQKS
jgi:hypothetical protein